MTVTLKPETTAFIESQVQAGDFDSAEALVEEAIALLKDGWDPEVPIEHRIAIAQAEAEAERVGWIDMDTAADQLMRKYSGRGLGDA